MLAFRSVKIDRLTGCGAGHAAEVSSPDGPQGVGAHPFVALVKSGPSGERETAMRITKKKLAAVGAGTALVLAGGGLALAYWSSTGTGSGSATTGTSSNFAVSADAATGGPLSPGGPSESVAIHVNNPSSGHQSLHTVHVTVANSDGTAWTSVAGCSAADYTVNDPTFSLQDLAGGATYDTSVTISMNNLSSNQDGCKGATVPLYVVAS